MMNKSTNTYSVKYYLPKDKNLGKKSSFQDKSKQSNYKVLVQDNIEDSVYLVDA